MLEARLSQLGARAAGRTRSGVTLSSCCQGSVSLLLPVPSAAPKAWHQPGSCLKSLRVALRQKLLSGCVSSRCLRSSAVKPVKILVSRFIVALLGEFRGGPAAPAVSRAIFACSRRWFLFLRSGNLIPRMWLCHSEKTGQRRGRIQLRFDEELSKG